MQIGSFSVELLSEGRFEVFKDGHINRAPEEDTLSQDIQKSTAGNSSVVGINPVLVQTGQYNILLDTGLGWGLDAGSTYTDVSNIVTNLAIFELTPEDITHVILSHLHYDHAAGSSFTNEHQQTAPTFPNATYYLHQQEWEHALTQVETDTKLFGANYRLDDFYRLVADNYLTFWGGQTNEIINGITAIHTGGHTPGHQIVRLENNGERAYYPGDLLPTTADLNRYAMSGVDVHAVQAKKEKVRLLETAHQEKALLLFYHSKHGKSGRLIRDEDKQYVLADIPKG